MENLYEIGLKLFNDDECYFITIFETVRVFE